MKKNIIIAILALTTIMSTVYAFYQQTEAKKMEALAKENERMAAKQADLARQQMILADEQRMIAIRNMEEAHKQRALAEAALKKRK